MKRKVKGSFHSCDPLYIVPIENTLKTSNEKTQVTTANLLDWLTRFTGRTVPVNSKAIEKTYIQTFGISLHIEAKDKSHPKWRGLKGHA